MCKQSSLSMLKAGLYGNEKSFGLDSSLHIRWVMVYGWVDSLLTTILTLFIIGAWLKCFLSLLQALINHLFS